MGNSKDLERNYGLMELPIQDTIIRVLKTVREFLFGQMEVSMMVCLLIIRWRASVSTLKQMVKWYLLIYIIVYRPLLIRQETR